MLHSVPLSMLSTLTEVNY